MIVIFSNNPADSEEEEKRYRRSPYLSRFIKARTVKIRWLYNKLTQDWIHWVWKQRKEPI